MYKISGVYSKEVSESKTAPVYLRLIRSSEDNITLAVVNEKGVIITQGILLSINIFDHMIVRAPDVNPEIGFKLDSYGRVIIS
jgi:hypothetical protein